MEKAQTGAMHNTESSSIVSCVNKTDINEVSKEKEEELLFGTEEEGTEDEDTLSDDSMRLRLSDDEDAEEQEDATTNDTNIAKIKSLSRTAELPTLDTIVEKTLSSDLQQNVKVFKSDSEEPAQKEHNNTAGKVPENSALDEFISENKRIQDNARNSKNTDASVSEFNEKCTLKSSKDLKITDVKNTCSNAVSEQHVTLENDNLSIINNRAQTNNRQNAELTIHNEENLKETASDSEEVITTNTCELDKLDNVDSNSSSVDSANIEICHDKKLSTTATVSNSNDNSTDEIIEKDIKNDNRSLKRSHAELSDDSDYVDLVKSSNSNDSSSCKDTSPHKSKNKNPEHMDVTESKSTSSTSKITEKVTNISLIQNQNNSSNVKGNTEVTNEGRDVNNKSVNNSVLQSMLLAINDVNDSNNENETKNVDTIIPRRKRIKKTIDTVQDHAEENKQETMESGRQKRQTAKNAEEIIRKKYLNSDSESNDSTDQFVIVNHKLKDQDARHLTSPPPLKRICSENEIFNGNVMKAKMNTNSEEKKDVTQLAFTEKFFRRDIKEKLPRLTQEELEELLIQKIVETIAMRSEIGQLREQARISERYQEVTRTRMQQLMKQVKDFEMVLNRNAIDRRANPDKSVVPIKINRSVGLQVSFITEHGVQNLRQATNLKSSANTTSSSSSSSSSPAETNNNATNLRRSGIKIRSPRQSPVVTVPTPIITQSSIQTTSLISTVTPAALVVAKPLEPQHTLTLSNQPTTVQSILSASQQQIQSQPQQTIVLNGKLQNQGNRPIAPKPRNNDLIDLTDEEEKNKSNAKVTTTIATPIIEQQLNATPKSTQSFQRVIQTIPANAITQLTTAQPASIKVITTNQQPASTALVNNVNSTRLAYVMQSGTGSPRQVLIANPNQQVQIRPANASNRPPFSTVTYKTGISTIANGAVRVLTTPVLSNVQISKHPAPLPDIPNYAATPGWKLPPPAPSLKISKVSNGIVLSWNMNLSGDKYADIASYQLYAYQEVAGVNPNTSLWKKVGDVRALPLPMACTLTQFSEGNNYYFAVRAVDTHSRKGQYSIPGNISL